MKKISYILAVAALIAACTPAEDMRVTTEGPDAAVLQCSDDVVLSHDNAEGLALTVNWSDNNNIATTGSGKAPLNATINTLQFSATEDFATVSEYLTDKGSTSAQFTVYQLNTICTKLGMEGNVNAPLYMRLVSTLGGNIDPVYSNVISVGVTPYTIDLSLARILNSSHEDTGGTLSRTGDGVYAGFMGVSGWYNWFLLEGDGTEWGNLGQDGKQFYISSEDSKWNMWFPEPAGCYYTIVNTGKAEWSALNIPALSVSGDISGDMVYDKAQNCWILTYTASGNSSINVNISGTGKQYDSSTGDSAYNEKTFGFGGTADNVVFGAGASAISVSSSVSGEASLILNLNTMTLTIEAGGAAPAEVSEYIYTSGADDGISGSWTFDNYLILYDEDNLAYAGVCNVHSLWGYRYYKEKDDWGSLLGFAGGDAYSGTLEAGKDASVPAPDAGMYLMKVSVSALTYSNTAFSSVQIAGVGDDWTMRTMEAGATAGTYTLSIDVTAATPWGFKIYFDESWDNWFGGKDGKLRFGADGCPVDDSFIGSSCLFTVDLCKGTYSIEKQ